MTAQTAGSAPAGLSPDEARRADAAHTGPMLAADGTPLKKSLARALRRQKLRALALIDTEAHEALPDVPPITEAYPAFETYLPWGPFFGVFVKEGTPDEVVAKLSEAYATGVENADFQQLMDDRGFEVMNISGDEAQAFLDKWQSVTSWLVHDAGIAKNSPEEFGIPRPE